MSKLTELVEQYAAAFDRKDELEAATKENNATIMRLRDELAKQMTEEGYESLERDGYIYRVEQKIKYSKRSDEDIAAAGLDFFSVLREEGLGDIIKETVNAQTLQSTIKAYIDENEELPDNLAQCISTYTYDDVTHRKATKKPARGGAR